MNKKKIILITISILVVSIVALAIYNTYSSRTKENIQKSIESERTEWGVENQSALAKTAIEEFTNQSVSESTTSRKKRLSKYFTEDSPALNYKNSNLEDPIYISTGKATSVDYCDEQEGGDLCLLVKVDTKLISQTEEILTKQTYWVTIHKLENNSFGAYDLGLVTKIE